MHSKPLTRTSIAPALLLWATACASGTGSLTPTLEDVSQTPADVARRTDNDVVAAVVTVPVTGDTPDAQARDFWRAHGSEFGIGPIVLDNPIVEVREEIGDTLVRHTPMFAGYRIYGAELAVSVRDGNAEYASAAVPTNLTAVVTPPSLTAMDAISAVNGPGDAQAETVIFDPTVFGQEGTTHLAWLITSPSVSVEALVDAHTADLLYSSVGFAQIMPRDIRSYSGIPASNVPVDLYQLLARAPRVINEAGILPGVAASPDSQSAYVLAGQVVDHYATHYGRPSISGAPSMPFLAVTNAEANPHANNNAFWFDGTRSMTFGSRFVTLDVMAHEMTHGVIFHTSRLQYQFESGALNEHLADVMAANVDTVDRWLIGNTGDSTGIMRSMRNPPAKNDPHHMSSAYDAEPGRSCDIWNDDCGSSAGCVGGNCYYDYGGVHINSNILNHMYFLLVDGGTHSTSQIRVRGIGIEKGEQLTYFVMTRALGPSSTFLHYRQSMVNAAQQFARMGRFSAADVCSVETAFAAVGIGQANPACTTCSNYDCEQCQQHAECGFVGSECVQKSTRPADTRYTTECVDRCAAASDCGACNGVNGCGWCAGSNTCVADGTQCSGDFLGTVSSCHDCSRHTTCSACASDAYCAFCHESGQCKNLDVGMCTEAIRDPAVCP